MAYVAATPVPPQFLDSNGDPLSGGTIEFYVTGTSTPATVYSDSSGTSLGTSATLNSRGVPQTSGGTATNIFYDTDVTYKIRLKDSAGSYISPDTDPFAAGSATSQYFLQAGTGAVSRTVQDKNRDIVSVFDFMTEAQKADVRANTALVDVTAAIQAAIDVVCTTSTNTRKALYFPAGTYAVTSNIKFPLTGTGLTAGQKIRIFGDNKWNRSTVVKATSSSVTKMFEFATEAEGATNSDLGVTFENICLDGNSLSTFGVWGAMIAHASFVRVFVTGFTSAGVSIGGSVSSGYCNEFTETVFYANEIGLQITPAGGTNVAANQNIYTHSKFWANTIGVDIQTGKANKFINCLFESNTGLGLRARTDALSLDTCYFEGNATTGISMTTPSFTMKADIYLKGGSSNTTLQISSPCVNVEIANCFTQAGDSANGCFVYAAAPTNLRLVNNNCKDTAKVPLLSTRFNNSYSFLRRVVVENNHDFSTELDLDGYVDTVLLSAARTLNWYKSDTAVKRNYANTEFNTWTFNSGLGGNGGTWARSSDTFQGVLPVWNLAHTATSLTYYARYTIDAADYPDLHNKYVAFALAMKASASGGSVTFRTTDFSAQASIATDWEYRTSIFSFPATGTVTIGFGFTGLNGNVSVANPLLFEVGADAELLAGQAKEQKIFYGSAAPTAGTWKQGDQVLDVSPTVDGNNMLTYGWCCTAAGSPGTWVPMYVSTVTPAT